MDRRSARPGSGARPLVLNIHGDADPADLRISPLLAADHSRLPSALIQVGEHDPLREDGARYAAALRAAALVQPAAPVSGTAS